ncbi:MAG TPA: hypothetical protein VGI45_03560 [Terracidiphilus sp.]|jgi:hypothetical protein
MQKQITPASLKSLDSNGYGAHAIKSMAAGLPRFAAMPLLQDLVNGNIEDIYRNLNNV